MENGSFKTRNNRDRSYERWTVLGLYSGPRFQALATLRLLLFSPIDRQPSYVLYMYMYLLQLVYCTSGPLLSHLTARALMVPLCSFRPLLRPGTRRGVHAAFA